MGVGGRGRPAAPTALKLVKGTRKSRINHAEPIPSAVEVVCPSWLGAEARALWEALAPELQERDVLTAWDAEHFGIWCDAAARRREASAMLDEQGSVIETPVFDRNGRLTGHRLARNPWVLVLKDTTDTMLRYGARFGLTPSDRSQLKVGPARPSGSGEDLLT
jgi:P27 family predicted phage terminase small subunit